MRLPPVLPCRAGVRGIQVTFVIALAAGYLIGGIPTADWTARRVGLDLRKAGSGNPGANNAMRIGGRRLGANILLLEITKGATAVFLGSLLAGDPGMVGAGIGAVNGNIHNPYRRFRGGQGLGITAGVLLGELPLTGAVGILVITVVVITTRSSPAGWWRRSVRSWRRRPPCRSPHGASMLAAGPS